MPYKNKELKKVWCQKNWLKRMLSVARHRAKIKNIAFTITEHDVEIPSHCPILGIPLVVGSVGGRMNSYSLDRVDNTKGYVPGNVRLISHKANTCKSNLSFMEIENLWKYSNGMV